MDENTAVIAPWSNKILNQIYTANKMENGSFKTLQAIDVNAKEQRALSIASNVLVVGLPNETEERGAVYVYNRDSTGSWHEMQRIVPADAQVDAEFGFSLEMDDDVMVIGAYNDRDIERKIGSVYVYRHNHNGNLWEFEVKLAPPDDGKIADFGRVVTIMQNLIAVGDQAYDPLSKPKHKGAVWIYEYNTSSNRWSLLKFIRNDDCDNWFGSSVSFTYDRGLLVGCAKDDDEAGALFYYELSSSNVGYVLRQKITTSDRDAIDLIAQANSVAVYSNVMAVGTGRAENGAVYIFLRKNDVWVETEKIVSPPDQEQFGRNVAMSGRNVIVSAGRNAFYYELIEGPSVLHCVSAKAGSAMLDSDCEGNCKPNTAIDRNIAAVADKNSIRIYSHDGNAFKVNASFEVDAPIKAVSVSDGTIIASITSENKVRIFETSSEDVWTETASLPHNASNPKESFGEAVDIDGDVAVVGANAYRSGEGSVYVFRRIRANWIEEGKLLPDDSYLNGFGTVLSVVNNTIADGDPRYNDTAGAVFIYHFNETSRVWMQMNGTISNEDCDGGFGSSLALTRDNGLFIGCPGYQSDMGAVYYYAQSEIGGVYRLIQKLQAVGGKANDDFGGPNQLAVDGNLLAVGTNKETNGTVHVFAELNSSWVEVETIHSPHGQRLFGYKVALSGRTLLVSSTHNVFPFSLGSDCS
ncbi:hypothetical protein QTG54_016641 [Skeletonema marinoi]|uniref:Uncharacterized protein n=1 Tax=Skeletonema marinoi TaxID=267567 RepID=A0AAD8XSA5_9STRA|nr:hypothetical protein QTG54_016641 [Skeletonema marinoi]